MANLSKVSPYAVAAKNFAGSEIGFVLHRLAALDEVAEVIMRKLMLARQLDFAHRAESAQPAPLFARIKIKVHTAERAGTNVADSHRQQSIAPIAIGHLDCWNGRGVE